MTGSIKVNSLNIQDNCSWKGLVTIKDLWDYLYYSGKISTEEMIKIEQMTHSEQQLELEKYPKVNIK